MATPPLRLTEMAHGGGCGCKLTLAVLSQILAKMPIAAGVGQLLVGTETDDDAAVYQINEHHAILAGERPCALRPESQWPGGHSIDSQEPVYGLVAIGMVDPSRVIRNNTARAGDKIVLTKGLGVGIYISALKRQQLDAPLYEEMVRSMTQLNAVGAEMRAFDGVHAMTDVTGFGLLGHLLGMF